ncbi:SCO4225 family membrane protein [Streptomyces sp. BH097]|uniref:SCO4225 family membrane protein n=1 Tax=unclassified Streptomyces TaxID=2593676 RepID=UPI003BB5D9C3
MNARTLLRLTVTNPASAVYLGLVGATMVFEAVVLLTSPDPGMVGVWSFFVTAPTSLVAISFIPEAPFGVLVAAVAVSALVQSLALGVTYDGLRGRLRRGRPA